MKKGFSPGQQGKYRPVVKQAWFEHCKSTGTAMNNKAEYRKWYEHELEEGTGEKSTKDLDHIKGFDAAILHFAIIAQDEYWINKISRADEDRLQYQLRRFLRDLSWLEKEDVGWDYVCGIYTQSRLPLDPDDCPAWMLYKVLQMLDTHIRRICRDYCIRPMELPTRSRPAIKPVVINPDADHLHVGHDLDKAHH